MNTSAIVIASIIGVLLLLVIIGFFVTKSSDDGLRQVGHRVSHEGVTGGVYTNDPSQYGNVQNVFVQKKFDWNALPAEYQV